MKSYLITDPSYYTSNPKILSKKLQYIIKEKSPDFICIRDKKTENYRDIVLEVKKKINHPKIFLHTHYQLAQELGFYGVHLPSSKFKDIKKAKDLGLNVVVSTHTLEEALHVEKLGANFITFSPIFFTPNKGIPKGLEKLKEINDRIDISCFALGGIVDKSKINICKKIGVYGFASISYFFRSILN
jgi:thiamine-phosphate pyrophosphorylase